MAIRFMAPIIFCAIVLPTISSGSDVFHTIDERQKQYGQAVEEGRESVMRAYAKEILKANQMGRSQDVTRLTDRMKQFRSNGYMMDPELYDDFIAFGTQTHKARQLLLRAYEEAEKECITKLQLEKAEELRATIKAQGLDSRLVSIRLAKRKTDFIHHADYLGFVGPIMDRGSRMNATFEMVAGLSDSEAKSFRSVNFPNFYLVHGDSRIRLAIFRDVEEFRRNATFHFAKGRGNRSALMFIPVNLPTHCIDGKEKQLWIDPIEKTLPERAEFEVVGPQFPFWVESAPMK